MNHDLPDAKETLCVAAVRLERNPAEHEKDDLVDSLPPRL